MKLNNKGFSLVELLGVMVILGIILTAGIAQYRKHIKETIDKSYDIMAESLESAAENYFMDHPQADSVTVEELVEEEYIEPIDDPSRKATDDQVCQGKIKKSQSDEERVSGALDSGEMSVSVCCEDYSYTYKFPTNQKSQDKYCKAYPYDMHEIKSINVLNIYPMRNGTKGNQLEGWMNSYGKGIIHVTPIYIEEFNVDPERYLGKSNNWNYDEVVFGFLDCNGYQDLSPQAEELVDQYLSEGGAAIFGHDTLTIKGCGSHTNFNKLAKYVNMELTKNAYTASTKVKISRKGIFTEYPWRIGDVGTNLTIPTSHVYGQVAHGDVWITFDINESEANKIYLSTWENNAFIQTGHSNGAATEDEQKIIANIIFYTFAKQYVEE
jgi:prepilin-type N-terminal cleavage/methylation domain-containing protein